MSERTTNQLVTWCFEPSQPQRITSGLKTTFSLSPSYSLNKLSNVSHKICKQLFKNASHKHFLNTLHILQNTPISRKKSKIISGITFRKSEYKDLSLKYFFLISNKSVQSVKMCLIVITALQATQTGAFSLREQK